MLYQQVLGQQRTRTMLSGRAGAGAIQAASHPPQVYTQSAPQTCRFIGDTMHCQ